MTTPLNLFEKNLLPMTLWSDKALARLDRWETGEAEGHSTGFGALDKWVRLRAAELLVIAGRPSMGKTGLGVQLSLNVASRLERTGDCGCVAIFSAEMAGTALCVRMASIRSGVNSHKLRMGKATRQEADSFRRALAGLRSLPIWIDDNSGPTTEQMLEQLANLNQTIPVRLMLFDFLELGGDRAQREDQRVGAIAHNLKGIAKALDIPVITLCQLNREVETRANKMPALSDLRYSGMVEQIADTVIFIMRPEYYLERGMGVEDVPEEDRKGVAYLQIAKQREGPVGKVKLAFINECACFADLDAVPRWPAE